MAPNETPPPHRRHRPPVPAAPAWGVGGGVDDWWVFDDGGGMNNPAETVYLSFHKPKDDKMSTYQIDKFIPVPGVRSVGAKYPFADMKASDSFLIPCEKNRIESTRALVYNSFRSFQKSRAETHAWKIITRWVEGGIRVWRTE